MCLAPMADVTDAAFRRIIAKYGKPDVMWTEFVSVDGLCSRGLKAMLVDLEFSPKERPIVAQLFGNKPANFERAAKKVAKLGFDGIDLNFGCPQKNIIRQEAGAFLIRKPKLAQEIIRATKKGAGKLPVSVKTRIGYGKKETERWLPAILEEKPAALTVHGRTKSEMSKVPADWKEIGRAVELRNKIQRRGDRIQRRGERPFAPTLIIGNGDVKTVEEARQKAKKYGVEGVMVGRSIFGNPWLFSGHVATKEERLKVLVEHAKLFEKLLGQAKSFSLMKKHFKSYAAGWAGAKELRMALMEANSAKEAQKIIQKLDKKTTT